MTDIDPACIPDQKRDTRAQVLFVAERKRQNTCSARLFEGGQICFSKAQALAQRRIRSETFFLSDSFCLCACRTHNVDSQMPVRTRLPTQKQGSSAARIRLLCDFDLLERTSVCWTKTLALLESSRINRLEQYSRQQVCLDAAKMFGARREEGVLKRLV